MGELASRFKVSSTPVREALHRLAGENLLMSIANRGFYSKVLTLDEMTELFVLSNILLQHAIAASSTLPNGERNFRDPADLGHPLQLNRALAAAQYIEGTLERIAALSRNNSLSVMIRNFNDRTHYVRLLDLEFDDRRSRLLQQTKCLIDQVEHQNSAGALSNLDDQLRAGMACLPRLVKEGLARSYATAGTSLASSDRIARFAWTVGRESH